jgi:hypothetical protein
VGEGDDEKAEIARVREGKDLFSDEERMERTRDEIWYAKMLFVRGILI